MSRKDRLSAAAERPLGPSSLVGSFFHGGPDRRWQGCVVAEVAPQVYLVELFEWIAGSSSGQRLVPLAEMADWTFYDSAEWMNNAYEHDLRWEREQERAQQDPQAAAL